MSAAVYMAVAPGGACYVGVTSQEPRKRWRFHITTARRGVSACKRLASAIRAHGMTERNFRVVRECSTLDEAKQWERALVRDFKPSLNMTRGGDCRPAHTAESRAKIGAASKGNKHGLGYKHSAETKALMSAAHRGNRSRAGVPQTTATRERISVSIRASEAYKRATAARRGVPCPLHAEKMRGRVASAETKAKMSASQKARRSREKAVS